MISLTTATLTTSKMWICLDCNTNFPLPVHVIKPQERTCEAGKYTPNQCPACHSYNIALNTYQPAKKSWLPKNGYVYRGGN